MDKDLVRAVERERKLWALTRAYSEFFSFWYQYQRWQGLSEAEIRDQDLYKRVEEAVEEYRAVS